MSQACTPIRLIRGKAVGQIDARFGSDLHPLFCLMRGRAEATGTLHYLGLHTVPRIASVHKRVALLSQQGSVGIALALGSSPLGISLRPYSDNERQGGG